jgi:hypothetical protein
MTQVRFNAFALSLAEARHRGPATLAMAALVLVVAGCGGSGGDDRLSKSEYERRIQHDGQEIKAAFTPLSKPPSSLAQFAKELKSGQVKLRAAANDLDGLAAPNEIELDNDVLVKGLRKLADQLEPLRKGAAKGDPKLVQSAVTRIQTSKALADAQDAANDMKRKGYKLGTLGQ